MLTTYKNEIFESKTNGILNNKNHEYDLNFNNRNAKNIESKKLKGLTTLRPGSFLIKESSSRTST